MLNIPEEVKELFKKNNIPKNIRIHFPNGEREDITNKDVIAETMSFTESICSQENLKFGLTEASVFQIETVGIGNIEGYTIEVTIEIDVSSLGNNFITEHGKTSDDMKFPFYSVPLGRFIVDTCQKQYRLNRRYVIAYSELLNEDIPLHKLEKIKENYGVPVAIPYSVDMATFMALHVNDYDFSKCTIEDAMDTAEDYYITKQCSTTGYVVQVHWKVCKYSVASTDNPKLFKAKIRKHCVSLEDKVAEMLEYLDKKMVSTDILDFLKKYCCKIAYGAWLSKYENYNVTSEELLGIYPIEYEYGNTGDDFYMDVLFDPSFSYDYEGKDQVGFRLMIPEGVYYGYYTDSTKTTGEYIESFYFNDLWEYDRVLLPEESYYVKIPRVLQDDGTYKIEEELSVSEIIHASAEINGSFLIPSRNGGVSTVYLKEKTGVYPNDTLYPRDSLFPSSTVSYLTKNPVEYVKPSHYSALWYDDFQVKPIGKIKVDYKNKDDEIVEYVYEFDSAAENVYYFENNFIFQNYSFTEEEVKSMLDTYFIPKIKGITYVPLEVDMKGLPYIESGDAITVQTQDESLETIVMRRTLTGIQSLIDSVVTSGSEVVKDTTEESLNYISIE